MLRTEDFNWKVPKELIAQEPATPRDSSRLLVLHRDTGEIQHTIFSEIGNFLKSGDALVINDTKVIPSRLLTDDGRVVLLLRKLDSGLWQALGEKGVFKLGDMFFVGDKVEGRVVNEPPQTVGMLGESMLTVSIEGEENLSQIGKVPLPPYITAFHGDPNRYQTIYAYNRGSAAAPTAGFHFTSDLLSDLMRKGVDLVKVTLHVSVDTFLPIAEDNVAEHKIYSEYIRVNKEAARQLRDARRIICVGTTSVRTIEQMYQWKGEIAPCEGFADIYILPGYRFHIDRLITNFHYPRSSNLLLTTAFAGNKDLLYKAYQTAIQMRYRFYSFGDAMLIV